MFTNAGKIARLLKTGAILPIVLTAAAMAQKAAPAATPKQRGFDALSADTPSAHGHHYVVVIGIDHYANWPVLGTAVSDATGFAKLLTSQFGFEYAVEPLTEQAATRDNINSLIDDDLRNRLKPEDDLIFFFAGHGTTRNDKVGDQTQSVGFLVPFEARAPGLNERWSDYINIDELLRTISSLPSEHILVILDSCHSGMALGSKFTTSRADTRFQQDMTRKVSRKVITSAQGDQLAADTGPLQGHSLFTGLMMQGLMTGKADTFGQGFITSTQLGAYTQHQVGVQEGSRQTPLFGGFDLDAGGELLIPLGAGAAAPAAASAKTSALTPLEAAEIAKLKKDERRYWQADDPLKNFPAARSATLKLCDAGDGWGCAQAANSFRRGLGGGMDYTRAVELARKGCEAAVTTACVTLGILYEDGQTIQPDLQSAARLYRDACTKGNLRGCSDLGNLYEDGRGVPQDHAQALSLYTQACNGGEMVGCSNLGRQAVMNTKGASDLADAIRYFTQSCDGGEPIGCYDLGQVYKIGNTAGNDPAKAAALFRKACDTGEMRGCNQLGLMAESGEGVPKDPAQAIALYRKSCNGGGAEGCFSLGAAMANGSGVPQDFAQAASMFRMACDGDDMRGCDNLGVLYENGVGVDKDAFQAVFFYRKACDGGDMKACLYTGMMIAAGTGAKQDAAEAATFYRKACDGGNAEACTRLKGNN